MLVYYQILKNLCLHVVSDIFINLLNIGEVFAPLFLMKLYLKFCFDRKALEDNQQFLESIIFSYKAF